MSKAAEGSTVKVAYVGKLKDGTVFDQSQEGQDLQVTIGSKEVIPGFENAITGMEPGEKKTVTIEADQAYGPRHEEAVVEVSRSQLPDNLEPSVGQRLRAQSENGQPVIVTITKLSDTTVTLDANHPLAGQDLTFDITLNDITKGSAE